MALWGVLLVIVGFLLGTFSGYVGYILPIKWENRNLREAITKGSDAILEAVVLTAKATINEPLVDDTRIKELEDHLKNQISETIIAVSDMEVVKAENNVLSSHIHILEQNIESMKFDIDMAEQNLSDVKNELSRVVNSVSVGSSASAVIGEVKDAIEDLLVTFDNPKTLYETGVYNGVIALSNTLLGKDLPMIKPTVVAPTIAPTIVPIKVSKPHTIQDPKRDAKGRFLKAA